MITGKLSKYLAEIDKTANERLDIIIKGLAEKETVPIHNDGTTRMGELDE